MVTAERKNFFKTHLAAYGTGDYNIEAIPVKKQYVHKKLEKNVVITMPVPLSQGKKKYRSRIIVANDNDFFFDHDLRHIPGMLMVEAVRQMALAITHAHYSISLQERFIINGLETRFLRLANKQDPVFVDGLIHKAMIREDIVHYMEGEWYIHQNTRLNAVIGGIWSTATRDVFKNLAEELPRAKYPAGTMINSVNK